MKKLIGIIISFCALFFMVSYTQSTTEENPAQDKSYTLYVKIDSRIDIDRDHKSLITDVLNKAPDLKEIYNETPFNFKKGIPMSSKKIQAIESKGMQKREGKRIGLANILKVIVENPTQEKLQSLKKRFEEQLSVAYCHLVSNEPISPPHDIFPETPSFRNRQEYIDEDPGVNMQYAWDMGVDGSGIFVRNIEYGFNKAHEDLNDVNAFYAPGRTVHSSAVDSGYTRHGTSVIGTLYADNGTYGVTGMVYGAEEVVLHPEWAEEYVTTDNPYGWDRIRAITEAIDNTLPGNVLIYQMQSEERGPAELDPIIWDLTQAATDNGIVIVAAAGNGGLDLDSADYIEYMSRGNSGAIIVGAGSSDLNHDALPYTTHGRRVDLQGWGNDVFTAGTFNGEAEVIASDVNQTYTNFTGTSSATAIVASCVIAVQSHHFNSTGTYLSGEEIRDILRDTGIPQGNATATSLPIGPLPNMEAALNFLDPIVNCSGDVYSDFDNADAEFADGDLCTAFPSGHFNSAWNTPFPWKATEFYAAYHILLTEDYWDNYGCNEIVNEGTATSVWMLGSSNPIDTSPADNESVMAFWVKRKHYESIYNGVYTQLENLQVGDQYRLTFYDSPVSTPGGRQTPNLYYRTKVKVEDALGVQEWDGPNTYYYNFTPSAPNVWHQREVIIKVTSSSMKLTLEFPLYPDPNNIVNDGYVAIDDIKIECIGDTQRNGQAATINQATFQQIPEKAISLSPNPTTGIIQIKTPDSKEEITALYVYDIRGVLVKVQKKFNSKTIDISELSNGIYFMKVATKDNKSYTQKVIKK